MLKLPKSLAAHPHLVHLEERFLATETPLLPELESSGSEGQALARVTVSNWPLDAALIAALHAARGTGHLLQGLELITTNLDREGKGLRAAQAKAGQPSGARLSRLLLLANDGAPRFYRDVAGLLRRHTDRLHAVIVAAPADELGRAFTPKGGPAKALLIDDKMALGLALSVLADELAKSP